MFDKEDPVIHTRLGKLENRFFIVAEEFVSDLLVTLNSCRSQDRV